MFECVLCCLVWLLPLALLAFVKMVRFVAPQTRTLLTDWRGKMLILEPGLTLLPHPFYFSLGRGPFVGFKLPGPPAAGTRVLVDPPPVQFNSQDRVSGVADVTVEMVVLPWDKRIFLLAKSVSFKKLAETRTNQWIASVLGKLPAVEISYSSAIKALNAEGALAALNTALHDCALRVERVSIDPNGVQLSKTYTQQLETINGRLQKIDAEQRAVERSLEVQAIERERERLRVEAEAERTEMKAQSALKIATLNREAEHQRTTAQKERIEALVGSGLDPHDVAQLLVVEASARMLTESSAEKIVAVPPGLLGLHGLGAFEGGTNAGSFVSVNR